MRDTRKPIDLSALADDYEIVGALHEGNDEQSYVATRKTDEGRRRDDQTGVIITVVTTPPGDEGHALPQLAADTQTLTRMSHRRLVPVIEGRWLGDDSYAVVTQRIADPTLAQRLVTGETFTTPRIAAILREVNGLLEWARSQNIVHRNITPERIFLEPRTDRVRVSFAIAPISRLHSSNADDDARTIARLAIAMLGGTADPESYDEQALSGLRSALPAQFGVSTMELLHGTRSGPEDVAAYLALIGMAEPLHAGESERDRIRAEILEEQRQEREKLANERAEFERTMANERAAFEAAMAGERGAFAKQMEHERARLAKERADLEKAVTKERAELKRALTTERAALAEQRAELERTVARQRAELERAATEDRRRIESLREQLKRAGELEIEKKRNTALDDITDEESTLDREELTAPLFVAPALAPIAPLSFNDDTAVLRSDPIVFRPEPEVPAGGDERKAEATGPSDRRKWILPGALAGAAAVAGVSAALLFGNRQPPTRAAAAAAAPARATAPASPPVVTATAAGAVPADSVAPRAFAVDSATAARWLDSLKTAHPLVSSTPAPRASAPDTSARRAVREAPARPAESTISNPFDLSRPVTPRSDSTPARRDSVARPDTTTPP